MGIANIINLCVLCVFTVAGLITGLVKGFRRVKSWGSDFLLSALATIGTGAILKTCGVSAKIAGMVIIACAIAYMLLFMGLSRLVRGLFTRTFDRREDEMQKLGGAGVANRLFGGYALAVKGFVIAATFCVLFYTAVDLTHISALKSAFESVYSGAVWKAVKPYIFDFIILGVINLAVRHGYSSGISSAAWGLLVLGLFVGSGFAAYNIVFKTNVTDGAVQSLAVKLGGTITSADLAARIAKWLMVALIFAAMAVVVFVTSFFVSRIITFARVDSTYYLVDGIFGAIVLTLIFIAAMLFLGYIIQPIYDLDFMKPLTDYFGGGAFARYFYTKNILTEFGLRELLPIREWFTAV